MPIAQLDRVLDYESRGRGFESLWARQQTTNSNELVVLFFAYYSIKAHAKNEPYALTLVQKHSELARSDNDVKLTQNASSLSDCA